MTVNGEPDSPDLTDPAAPSDTKSARRLAISGIREFGRRWLARWRPILLTVLLIAAVGWSADLFYFDYRPDLATDKASAREVVRAASDGVVALLSYSPDSLNRDIENAKSRVTSDFQTSFKRFTEQVVAPAAQRGQLTTTVRVIRAALVELHPNTAVVFMFISQKTISKEKPEPPVNTTSGVRVNLTKVKDAWLISKFDSV